MSGVSGVGPSHGGIPPQKSEPTKEINVIDFLKNYTWQLAAIARLEKE